MLTESAASASPLPAEEAARLRAQVRDLVAVTALPAVWVGADAATIAESFADSLVSLLRVDFAYVRVAAPESESLCLGRLSRNLSEEVLAVARECASGESQARATAQINGAPFCVFTARLESGGPLGSLVVGDGRPGFPSGEDELLLRVARNQASIALRAAAVAAGQQRLIRESRERERQLHELAAAALTINSMLPLDEMLTYLARSAADLIGAHLSVVVLTRSHDWNRAVTTVHVSEKYGAWQIDDVTLDGSGIYAIVCEENRPIRLTQSELLAHPRWHAANDSGAHPPLRGWLAAPLVSRDGRNIGLIQLSDKFAGDFTQSDEDILLQLAQLASIAVETHQLMEAIQRASAAKDELLGLVSHELRTPLTIILGLSETLQRHDADIEVSERRAALSDLALQAARLQRYIEDMLILARLEVGSPSEPEPIVLARLLDSLVADLGREDARTYRLNLAPGLPLVYANATHVEQIVRNLVTNSRKYSSPDTPIEIAAHANGGEVTVTISDEGPPVSAETLQRLFEPFYRDSKSAAIAPGVGLGLAVCQRLVEAAGGRIWATPRESGGIAVAFNLQTVPEVAE